MTKEIGIDPACFDLAEHFLADVPAAESEDSAKCTIQSLAEHIQRAVEDWFEAQNWEAS